MKCKKKTRSAATDKKELSSTLMGFKTAVQKAAFKHEQVFFPSHLQLNKCDFRLLRLSLSLFLSPSSSSPPLSPLVLFTCKSQSCTRYAGGLSPPRFDFFSNQVLKKELLALHRDWAAFYNPEKMHFEKTISICHLNGGGGTVCFFEDADVRWSTVRLG